MQQATIDSNIIQSTTVKTIKELKKLGDSRVNLDQDDNEQNDSTVSGKITPEGETSKTQHTKITISKKAKLSFNKQLLSQQESMKQTVLKTNDDADKSNGFRRASQRYGSLRPQKQFTQQLQLQSEPVDINIGLNLILTKSKTVREEFEQLQLTNTLITKYIKNDKHFHFSFQAFLDLLVAKGKMAQNMTNIQKPVLQLIEQFAIDHAKRCIQKNTLNQQYEEKTKHIATMMNRYQKELTSIEQNIQYF